MLVSQTPSTRTHHIKRRERWKKLKKKKKIIIIMKQQYVRDYCSSHILVHFRLFTQTNSITRFTYKRKQTTHASVRLCMRASLHQKWKIKTKQTENICRNMNAKNKSYRQLKWFAILFVCCGKHRRYIFCWSRLWCIRENYFDIWC